jgi:uncharacterized protein (TIGR03084 family)
MPADLPSLCDDLWAEQRVLVSRVEALDDDAWRLPTPAQGWSVGDTVSHLCFFTEQALLAATDPDRFVAERTVVADLSPRPDLALTARGPDICDLWLELTAQLVDAVLAAPARTRVPWYGPDMSRASFVTARIMETWAHGQDVADALTLPPSVSARLRHVCHLGVLTREFSYANNRLAVPSSPVAVHLTGPGGESWNWNDGKDAVDRVDGTALDFALVVTQRRHVSDTALEVVGDAAEEWMEIAQAFAGQPTRTSRGRA